MLSLFIENDKNVERWTLFEFFFLNTYFQSHIYVINILHVNSIFFFFGPHSTKNHNLKYYSFQIMIEAKN